MNYLERKKDLLENPGEQFDNAADARAYAETLEKGIDWILFCSEESLVPHRKQWYVKEFHDNAPYTRDLEEFEIRKDFYGKRIQIVAFKEWLIKDPEKSWELDVVNDVDWSEVDERPSFYNYILFCYLSKSDVERKEQTEFYKALSLSDRAIFKACLNHDCDFNEARNRFENHEYILYEANLPADAYEKDEEFAELGELIANDHDDVFYHVPDDFKRYFNYGSYGSDKVLAGSFESANFWVEDGGYNRLVCQTVEFWY